MAQFEAPEATSTGPLSSLETWQLSEEIRIVNSLREELARAMQARASQTLRLKALAESQHGSLAVIEQEVSAAGEHLSQSSTMLQDGRLLVEKLAAASFHLQRTRGIFSRQLASSKELLSEHMKHVDQLKQKVKPYREESVKLAHQMEMARDAMQDIMRIHEEEMKQQSQLKAYGEDIQRLEEERRELEPELSRMQKDMAESADAYKGQQSQSREQLEELRNLKNEQAELKRKEELLEVELEKLHQQKKELENAAKNEEQCLLEVVREKEQKLEEICDSRKQVDLEMAAATERMYSSIARMNQLRERDTEITKKRSTLETALQQNQQEITRLKAQSTIIGDSQRATEEVVKLKAEILNAENRRQQKESEEEELQQEVKRAEREVLAQQTEYESLLRDEAKQAAELDARKTEASALASELAQMSCRAERFRTLRQQLESTEEAIVSEKTEIERLTELLTRKTTILEKLEEEKETVSAERSRLEECLAMLRAEISSIREEAACLHESFLVAKKELEAAAAKDDSADTLGKREADLEADLDVFKKQLESQYQAAVEGIRCELKTRYESILARSIENEKERLETQFHQEEIAVEAELRRLEHVHEGKTRELAELEKRLEEGEKGVLAELETHLEVVKDKEGRTPPNSATL